MKNFLGLGLLILAAATGTANASLVLVDGVAGSPPAGATRVARAVGTFNNPAGGAARLEAAGQPAIQAAIGGGSGWWSGAVTRSWELLWNNSAGTLTFRLFAADDWTGPAAMAMTQTPAFTPGNVLAGVDFGLQLASTTFSSSATLAYSDIQFDSGSGFAAVPTAVSSYTVSGSFLTSNYHALSGALTDFTLRGKSTFSGSVSTSSDFSRFYVDAYQAVVPVPPAAWLFAAALGALGIVRRRLPTG